MAKSHKSSKTYIRGYTRADGVKVKGHYSHPKGRSSRGSSRKSSRKCSPPKSQYIRSFKRSNGTRVKGHCSRPRGKSLKCSPPKSQYVRSFKRSNGTRVKAHCAHPRKSSRASPSSFVASSLVARSPSASSRASPRLPACSSYNEKESCISQMDKAGLRRCRYNMTSNTCERLPKNLRQRATYQVGGGVVGQQTEGYTRYSAQPGRLSAERLQPFQGNAFYL
jgi:hypothetical protein